MHRPSILLVDDDKTFANLLKTRLEVLDYSVTIATTGKEAVRIGEAKKFQIVIIELGVPLFNRFEVLKTLRIENPNLPVIMMSTNSNLDKEISSYQSGASIFHRKPINYELLLTQIYALTESSHREHKLTIGGLIIDPTRRLVTFDETRVNLSRREFAMLLTLAEADGRLLSRENLLDKINDGIQFQQEGTVDTMISRIRKKLTDAKCDDIIETVHGEGYRIKQNLKR